MFHTKRVKNSFYTFWLGVSNHWTGPLDWTAGLMNNVILNIIMHAARSYGQCCLKTKAADRAILAV